MRIAVLVKGTGAKHRNPLFQLDIFLVVTQLKKPPTIRAYLHIHKNSNLTRIIVSVVTSSIAEVHTKSGYTEAKFNNSL